MANHVEVFLSIICDEETVKAQKLQACTRIQRSLSQIKGIKETYLTGQKDIADITAFAQWDESEIPIKLEEIREIKGIKKVDAKILVPI